MPYAANNVVSRAPIPGGIEITDEQYKSAIAAMAAGKVVSIDGGFNLVDPGQTPQPPTQPPTIEELRAAKLAEIDAAFSQEANSLLSGYPEAERLTWPIQQQEALSWEADNEAETPYLDGLAAARGIAREDMLQRTLAQVQAFIVASQSLVGKRQKLRDTVNAVPASASNAAAQIAAISW